MIEEMRWTALACKWADQHANHATAREVFNAATIDGAAALGRDDVGRLAAGAKADIVIVDLGGLHIGPVGDPIKSLVYAADGGDIETVIVDGKVVVKGGKVPGVDEAALIERAVEAHLWTEAAVFDRSPHRAARERSIPWLLPHDWRMSV